MRRTSARCALLIILLMPTLAAAPRTHSAPQVAGCPLFPEDHIWNAPIAHLPLDPNSAHYIAAIGADVGLHPDFGSGTWEGGPIGIPYGTVPPSQGRVAIHYLWADESDAGPFPIPTDAPIEGGAQSDGDRHVLVVERENCRLYELYRAFPQADGSWRADAGAVFDLRGYALRPDGWTSADAAGLAILPGLVRYEEVAAGEMRHAIRFTAPQTRDAHVWPARHDASSLTATHYPPMGQHFRLCADFDLTPFDPQVQVILRALQRYGMILADNGSPWYLSGAPDPRWDNDLLRQLRQVKGRDFEAVDVSGLMQHPDSGQVRAQPQRRVLLPLIWRSSS